MPSRKLAINIHVIYAAQLFMSCDVVVVVVVAVYLNDMHYEMLHIQHWRLNRRVTK